MSRCVYNRLTVSGGKDDLAVFSTEVRTAVKNAADKQCSKAWYAEAGLLDAFYDSKMKQIDGSIIIDWITDRETPAFELQAISKTYPKCLFEFVFMDEGPDYAGAESYKGGVCLAKVFVPHEEMRHYYAIPNAENGLDEDDDEVVVFDDLVPALVKRLVKEK